MGAADWKSDALILVLFVALTGLVEFNVLTGPFHRGFYTDDESITLPMGPNSVPVYALIILAVTVPLLVILWCHYLRYQCQTQYRALLGRIIVVFGFGLFLTVFVTDTLKVAVGRLRPDFIARCQPDYALCTTDPAGCMPLWQSTVRYISMNICTGDAHTILEGRKSFPSGHSSVIMFSMAFSMVYIERYTSMHHISFALKPIVQLFMLTCALLVGISRVQDHWHHPTDVMAGFMIGLLSCYATYYLRELPPALVHKHDRENGQGGDRKRPLMGMLGGGKEDEEARGRPAIVRDGTEKGKSDSAHNSIRPSGPSDLDAIV